MKNDAASGAGAPGLYVHVPFCRTKCPYCNFYSTTAPGGERRWLDALALEAAQRRGTFEEFDTIYIGGGTPSTLDAGDISLLAGAVRGAFPIADACEVTIEANPDDVDPERLAAWRAAGVTRLSLGVQSFDDGSLQRLGRRHDAGAARAAIALARGSGFDNLGLDLIYGIDGQSELSWMRTLEEALAFEPEHLSCYELTVERETPPGDPSGAGSLRGPAEETARRLFLETSSRLRARGYVQYEVSNFARDASLVSRHNSKYWRREPYLGLGPSAHSFRGERRWWNVRSLDAYASALERGGSPVEEIETLGEEERRLETLALGFRTSDGVPLAALRGHPRWEETLDRLARDGLVEIEGDRAVPTIEGLCVADRLPLLFAERP